MMIPNWLHQRAKLTPELSAIAGSDGEWNYRELYDTSLEIAQHLHGYGISAGDRVALLSQTNYETVCFIHACWLLSTEIVFLNNRLTK